MVGLVVWIAKYTQDKFQKLSLKNLILAITLVLNLIYFAGSKNFEFRDKLDFIFTDFRFFVVFCYFFVGASFYVFLDKISWTLKWFLASCFGIWIGFNFNLLGLLLPICGTYWILYLTQTIPVQNLAKKYGDWSYGVYIYSSPILSILHSFGVPQFGFYIYSSMAVTISIVFGYLSYHLVEKQFLKR
jgi:peptidoglycan/LPS O-acetylase OafA/YrhL